MIRTIKVGGDYAARGDLACTGGTIKDVIVDVSGDQYVDQGQEAIAIFARG